MAIVGRWSPVKENRVSAMTAKTALTAAMIEIHGPRDGKFTAKFTAADGRALAISVPVEQATVLREIHESMPYGIAVHDLVAIEAEVE
jgi:hypothetical protein